MFPLIRATHFGIVFLSHTQPGGSINYQGNLFSTKKDNYAQCLLLETVSFVNGCTSSGHGGRGVFGTGGFDERHQPSITPMLESEASPGGISVKEMGMGVRG